MSISGGTVVVGAHWDDDNGGGSGSAYIFVRSGATWFEQAKLTASDGSSDDRFGTSVAISGDTVAVGARKDDDNGVDSGSVYVYTRSGTIWNEQAKLTASDGAAGDNFGISVAIAGDIIVVGAWYDDDNGVDSGSVYIHTRSGIIWTEQAKLTASDGSTGDLFGVGVDISGDTIAVGARGGQSAYVYVYSGATWIEQAKLTASDGAANDSFGYSVAIKGDTIVVGAYRDDDNGNNSGSAYVYTRTGTTWTEQTKLTASDGAADDNFGFSVAIAGDTIVVGAWYDDDNGVDSGSVYVYKQSGTTWNEVGKITPSDGSGNDLFGKDVAISGNNVVVGSHKDDDNGADSGSAYVFNLSAGNPTCIMSSVPSISPSLEPSTMPSDNPTVLHSDVPSTKPSWFPSTEPSAVPSDAPSNAPSMEPSTSTVPTVVPSPAPTFDILFVVSDDTGLSPEEDFKTTKFENWNFTVDHISHDATEGEYAAKAAECKMIFIGHDLSDTNTDQVGTKLLNTRKGVVIENYRLYDEFEISSGVFASFGPDIN